MKPRRMQAAVPAQQHSLSPSLARATCAKSRWPGRGTTRSWLCADEGRDHLCFAPGGSRLHRKRCSHPCGHMPGLQTGSTWWPWTLELPPGSRLLVPLPTVRHHRHTPDTQTGNTHVIKLRSFTRASAQEPSAACTQMCSVSREGQSTLLPSFWKSPGLSLGNKPNWTTARKKGGVRAQREAVCLVCFCSEPISPWER